MKLQPKASAHSGRSVSLPLTLPKGTEIRCFFKPKPPGRGEQDRDRAPADGKSPDPPGPPGPGSSVPLMRSPAQGRDAAEPGTRPSQSGLSLRTLTSDRLGLLLLGCCGQCWGRTPEGGVLLGSGLGSSQGTRHLPLGKLGLGFFLNLFVGFSSNETDSVCT